MSEWAERFARKLDESMKERGVDSLTVIKRDPDDELRELTEGKEGEDK